MATPDPAADCQRTSGCLRGIVGNGRRPPFEPFRESGGINPGEHLALTGSDWSLIRDTYSDLDLARHKK